MLLIVANRRKRNWKKAKGLRVGLLKKLHEGSKEWQDRRALARLNSLEAELQRLMTPQGYRDFMLHIEVDAFLEETLKQQCSLAAPVVLEPGIGTLLKSEELVAQALRWIEPLRVVEGENRVEKEFLRLSRAVDAQLEQDAEELVSFDGLDSRLEEEEECDRLERIYHALREKMEGRGDISLRANEAIQHAGHQAKERQQRAEKKAQRAGEAQRIRRRVQRNTLRELEKKLIAAKQFELRALVRKEIERLKAVDRGEPWAIQEEERRKAEEEEKEEKDAVLKLRGSTYREQRRQSLSPVEEGK